MLEVLLMPTLADFKYWVREFPAGSIVYQGKDSYRVITSGIDFLILKRIDDGSTLRLLRNTPETLAFSDQPRTQLDAKL